MEGKVVNPATTNKPKKITAKILFSVHQQQFMEILIHYQLKKISHYL